jgi:hypothetical protein
MIDRHSPEFLARRGDGDNETMLHVLAQTLPLLLMQSMNNDY